jgi:hypothetical protein
MILTTVASIVVGLIALAVGAIFGLRVGLNKLEYKEALKNAKKRTKEIDSLYDYSQVCLSKAYENLNLEQTRIEVLKKEIEYLKTQHAKDLAISHQALEAVRANASVLAEKLSELERNNLIDNKE